MAKLPYALKHGVLTHISEVESGLNCKCHCPACGADLIAKKGDILAHHFAHEKGEDCNRGTRAMLNMLAKSVLEEERRLKAPRVFLLESATDIHYISNEIDIKFDRVEFEGRFDKTTPNIALHSGNQSLLLEITYENNIEKSKLQKISSADISFMEIDLSSLQNISFTTDLLKNLLIDSLGNKIWRYNKKAEYYKRAWLAVCDKFSVEKRSRVGLGGKVQTLLHIDGCPLKKRAFRQKSYANLRLDCFECEYWIEDGFGFVEYENIESVNHIYCSGKNKIADFDELKAFVKQRNCNIQQDKI